MESETGENDYNLYVLDQKTFVESPCFRRLKRQKMKLPPAVSLVQTDVIGPSFHTQSLESCS